MSYFTVITRDEAPVYEANEAALDEHGGLAIVNGEAGKPDEKIIAYFTPGYWLAFEESEKLPHEVDRARNSG